MLQKRLDELRNVEALVIEGAACGRRTCGVVNKEAEQILQLPLKAVVRLSPEFLH